MSTRVAMLYRKDGRPAEREVAAYLPSNYKVTCVTDTMIIISGTDRAGWTLDDYVIPRLASGWITAWETANYQACGCLTNDLGAHRVGCPEHPEGVNGG